MLGPNSLWAVATCRCACNTKEKRERTERERREQREIVAAVEPTSGRRK